MDYKKLVIRGISYSQTQSGTYALLLEEVESSIKLPVVIGSFEAQSISLALEKDLKPVRPLTHDLFASFIRDTNYSLEYIVIYQIIDGVFFSHIHFKNNSTRETLFLDARTSDAVAMAVRFGVSIYTTKEVLEEAGILLEIQQLNEEDDIVTEFHNEKQDNRVSLEELRMQLDEAVKNEDFDLAFQLQEEIKKRQRPID
ncbi:bifunctional nuclease family protein [Riemerella anatipestifer]|uniref:bifunctional nuclease family protein n=1 Tax=Riemerella anatipestifer TaxID=34085 RepID=UPI0023645C4D|nr:bifunctional nuclease family protein [Riemerella anatipestifer]MDD1539124.1 bifunctional nuclease family protein [Riemerella anatipestifer]